MLIALNVLVFGWMAAVDARFEWLRAAPADLYVQWGGNVPALVRAGE